MSATDSAQVLVVDDEEVVRGTIAARLRKHGYLVSEAADGDSALALCARSDPDVIVVDLAMPGLDGVGFISAYRKLPASSARIVVISARAGGDEIAARLMADAFLAKPFSLDEILVEVRRLV